VASPSPARATRTGTSAEIETLTSSSAPAGRAERPADSPPEAEICAAISNAMTGIKKRCYGKGPVKARTYLNDRYVFCALEGGLTKNEQILVDAGEEDLVRAYRLRFQAVVRDTAMQSVTDITGRKVVGYHSQIMFDPVCAFEVFILDEPFTGAAPE
jgi:uncharacterized protein YbcI